MDINDIYRPVEQEPVAPAKRPGGKKAISVIISIFLFVGMLGLLLLVLARQIGTKSTIKTAIKEMDIANLDLKEVLDVEEDTNLTDFVYEEIVEYEEFKDVTKDDIKEFLEEDVSDYFAGALDQYVDVLYTGEGSVTIDINEIVDIIEESDNEYLKDIEITPEIKEEIKASIDELNIETITTETLVQEDNTVFKVIRKITAPSTLAIAGGIVLFLALLLVVINLKYTKSWMLHISVPMIITGVILIVAGVVLKVFDIKGMVDGGAMVDSIVEAVQTALSGKVFLIAGIAAAVGVVITIGAAVISHINKKKTATE